MYTFHATFAKVPEVGDQAEADQGRFARLGGMDLIPRQWLHMTMQGLGFSDEIPPVQVRAVAGDARARLAAVSAPLVTIGPAVVADEGIAYYTQPPAVLDEARREVRAAITSVLGAGALREGEGWTPHVSIAYASEDGTGDRFDAALGVHRGTVTVHLPGVQLIELRRGDHLYTWETIADLPFRIP